MPASNRAEWEQAAARYGYRSVGDMLRTLYVKEGRKVLYIADHLGFSYGNTRAVMQREGVPIRPTGGYRRR